MSKRRVLLAASAIALCLPATSAFGFDRVNWRWNADVTTDVDINADINVVLDPSGLTMIEALQVHVGDVSATSTVNTIYNNPPGGGGGPIEVELGTIDLEAQYGLGGNFLPGGTATGDVVNGTVVSGAVDETDIPPNANGTVTATIDLGTITVDPAEFEPLDAVAELPEVVSTATAVGNNMNIESTGSTQLHLGQLLFSLCGGCEEGEPTPEIANLDGDLLSNLTPAEITAISTVYDILNASVDSSATAVGNNISVNLDPATPDDNALVADIKQISLANVSATSQVYGVSVNNYTNLGAFRVGGELDRPLINSAATAVGNNLSIRVGPIEP